MPPPPPPGGWVSGPGGYAAVPDYLPWAILVTLFCCLPFGIVAIVYAAQASSRRGVGDVAGALEAARNAKTWVWVSFAVGLAVALIYLVVVAVAVATDSDPGMMGRW